MKPCSSTISPSRPFVLCSRSIFRILLLSYIPLNQALTVMVILKFVQAGSFLSSPPLLLQRPFFSFCFHAMRPEGYDSVQCDVDDVIEATNRRLVAHFLPPCGEALHQGGVCVARRRRRPLVIHEMAQLARTSRRHPKRRPKHERSAHPLNPAHHVPHCGAADVVPSFLHPDLSSTDLSFQAPPFPERDRKGAKVADLRLQNNCGSAGGANGSYGDGSTPPLANGSAWMHEDVPSPTQDPLLKFTQVHRSTTGVKWKCSSLSQHLCV